MLVFTLFRAEARALHVSYTAEEPSTNDDSLAGQYMCRMHALSPFYVSAAPSIQYM
jgi:hypothetical protein